MIRYVYADSPVSTTPPAPGAQVSEQSAGTTTATTAGAPPQPSMFGMLLPFVLMFGVVYFLIIRPQQKKMKEHQNLLGTIQQGDEVVTTSGIFGKVTGVTEKVLTVEISQGVRIKMLKSQVASVNPKNLDKALEANA